jgi:hypothetical protein
MTIPLWLSIFGFCLGAVGAVGGAWAVIHSRYREQTDKERDKYEAALENRTELLETENAAYRRELTETRAELASTREQVAELRGQVALLGQILSGRCKFYESDPATGGCMFCGKGLAYGEVAR